MLQNLSHHKLLNKKPSVLNYLQLLGSILYVLIHKNKQDLKRKKFTPKVSKSQLVDFDSHTIFCMHIKNQNRVIRIKDFCIFEDTKINENIGLPNYKNGKPSF